MLQKTIALFCLSLILHQYLTEIVRMQQQKGLHSKKIRFVGRLLAKTTEFNWSWLAKNKTFENVDICYAVAMIKNWIISIVCEFCLHNIIIKFDSVKLNCIDEIPLCLALCFFWFDISFTLYSIMWPYVCVCDSRFYQRLCRIINTARQRHKQGYFVSFLLQLNIEKSAGHSPSIQRYPKVLYNFFVDIIW